MNVIVCPPTKLLGTELLRKEIVNDLDNHVAFLEGAIVDYNTVVHTLFKKTIPASYIKLLSEICEFIGS